MANSSRPMVVVAGSLYGGAPLLSQGWVTLAASWRWRPSVSEAAGRCGSWSSGCPYKSLPRRPAFSTAPHHHRMAEWCRSTSTDRWASAGSLSAPSQSLPKPRTLEDKYIFFSTVFYVKLTCKIIIVILMKKYEINLNGKKILSIVLPSVVFFFHVHEATV